MVKRIQKQYPLNIHRKEGGRQGERRTVGDSDGERGRYRDHGESKERRNKQALENKRQCCEERRRQMQIDGHKTNKHIKLRRAKHANT